MNQELQHLKAKPQNVFLIALAMVGLAASFMLQDIDVLNILFRSQAHPYLHFITRKVLRVVMNDSCLLLIIHVWFNDKNITRLAWKIQMIDTCILLPLYLILKLSLEGDNEISSPLLSQLHRVIVNPTLMILIIPGVYFQRLKSV